jgi:hypothetical protein
VLGTAASLDVAASGDASTTQVVKGDDTRLSNARAPQSHAASHAAGGFDPVTISATQVTGIAASLSGQNVDRVARLGVNTADTTNPLSVNGATALFSNSGDIRVTLSKGAESDTASLVLQDNFSGRAEIGLTGDDDLTIKTSPDGTTFNNAIVVGAASGAVSFPNTGGFIGDSGAGGASGLVPAPPAGAAAAGKFLKADGTWAVPPGSGVSGLTATVTQFPDHIDVSLDPSIASASVVPASDKISITLE